MCLCEGVSEKKHEVKVHPAKSSNLFTHFKNMNTTIVIAMATNETATPTFPMIPNAKVCDGEMSRGLALSKMAK